MASTNETTAAPHADPTIIPETEEEQIRKRREEYNKMTETDEIVFSATAVLYRYQIEAQNWVGRGKGKLRVSLVPTSNKYRILQIREKVFKLGCNHYVENQTLLTKYPLAEHAWIWTTFGDDCGDGLDKTQKYLARFNTAEEAEQFNAAIEKGRELLKVLEREKVKGETDKDSGSAEEGSSSAEEGAGRREHRDRDRSGDDSGIGESLSEGESESENSSRDDSGVGESLSEGEEEERAQRNN